MVCSAQVFVTVADTAAVVRPNRMCEVRSRAVPVYVQSILYHTGQHGSKTAATSLAAAANGRTTRTNGFTQRWFSMLFRHRAVGCSVSVMYMAASCLSVALGLCEMHKATPVAVYGRVDRCRRPKRTSVRDDGQVVGIALAAAKLNKLQKPL